MLILEVFRGHLFKNLGPFFLRNVRDILYGSFLGLFALLQHARRFEDRFGYIDRALGPQSQRDGIAGTRINNQFSAADVMLGSMVHFCVTNKLFPERPEFSAYVARLEARPAFLRTLKIEPGGHIGLHDHKDRPAVVLFQQGTYTVTNGDGSSKTFKAGDTTAEGVKTVHWHKNTGSDDLLFVTADLVKKQAN